MIKSKKKRSLDFLKLADDIFNSLMSCDIDTFKLLLQDGISLDFTYDKSYNTILHLACEQDKPEFVDHLMKIGADPNIQNLHEVTPFHLSLSRPKIFALFVKKKKVNVNAVCKLGNSILHIAALRYSRIDFSHLETLIKRGLDINLQNSNKDTPLHLCCIKGHFSLAESLMKCPNLNYELQNGKSKKAIYLAALHGHTKILGLFLKYKRISETSLPDLEFVLTKLDSVSDSDLIISFSKCIKKFQAKELNVTIIDNINVMHMKLSNMPSRSKSQYPDHDKNPKLYYSQEWNFKHNSLNLEDRKFSRASNRILIMDEIMYCNDFPNQIYEKELIQIDMRKSLEKELSEELDSIIGENFSLQIIRKILKSKSFKWHNANHKNKIELLKWMADFLNEIQLQRFLRYLKEKYPSEISIHKRNSRRKEKSRLLTLKDKMIRSFDWEIEYDDIQFYYAVGIGSFGSVYKGALITTGEDVALKQLVNISDDHILTFVKEISILSRLIHPNIIQFKGASLDTNMILVMEYAELGDLKSYLQNNVVPWKIKLRFAKEIACGMAFLHSQSSPVAHRDLKCQNILITSKIHAKVSDFGISKLTNNNITAGSTIGSLNWLAPEILRGDNIISTYVDVYAFAMVMYEIITNGETPFDHCSPIQILRNIDEGKRPPIPDNCDQDYVTLMEKCWSEDPLNRPSFEEINDTLTEMINKLKLESKRRRSPKKRESDGSKKLKRKENKSRSPKKTPVKAKT